jgi:serine protease DegQ
MTASQERKMKTRSIMAAASGIVFALTAGTVFAQWPFVGNADEKPTLAPLLREITPAVVSIRVETQIPATANPLLNDPFFEQFGLRLPPQQPQPRLGAGSGVIIDAANGYVVTNHHVIAQADLVTVVLNDRRQFEAEVVGSDEGTDIALLRIDATGLSDLDLGDSDSLEVGDFVLAIGNPFGLGQTVTSGIVSALGRGGISAEGYEDFIQTDASINPGNSGGALIDLTGRLVGINSAIIAPAGGNVGIGFAVPSDMAAAVVDQLLEFGGVQRGVLGVGITDLAPDLADDLGVDRGAVIGEVNAGSAAERAGLAPGDVIVEFDGKPIDGSSDLRNQVGLVRAGSTVGLVYVRDGQRETVNVTIGEASGTVVASGGARIERLPGAVFRDLGPNDPQYRRLEGVVVAQVAEGSPAALQGLMAGDIVTGINNRRQVRSVEEFASLIGQTRGTFALNIVRDGRGLFLVIR